MSTSLLYHGFGVRDYRHLKTSYKARGIVFTIERRENTYRCAACDSDNVWRQGVVVRRLRALPRRVPGRVPGTPYITIDWGEGVW